MPLEPARYHSIRDEVLAGVDEALAEPVELAFLKDGVVDPDLPDGVTVEAVLRTEAGEVGNLSGGRGQGWNARVAAQPAMLAIDRAGYSGPVPRGGDKVRALARPNQPWFEISHVDDRGHTRLVCHLREVG